MQRGVEESIVDPGPDEGFGAGIPFVDLRLLRRFELQQKSTWKYDAKSSPVAA